MVCYLWSRDEAAFIFNWMRVTVSDWWRFQNHEMCALNFVTAPKTSVSVRVNSLLDLTYYLLSCTEENAFDLNSERRVRSVATTVGENIQILSKTCVSTLHDLLSPGTHCSANSFITSQNPNPCTALTVHNTTGNNYYLSLTHTHTHTHTQQQQQQQQQQQHCISAKCISNLNASAAGHE